MPSCNNAYKVIYYLGTIVSGLGGGGRAGSGNATTGTLATQSALQDQVRGHAGKGKRCERHERQQADLSPKGPGAGSQALVDTHQLYSNMCERADQPWPRQQLMELPSAHGDCFITNSSC